MQTIYIVKQQQHSDNSEQYSDYEPSGSTDLVTVGTFLTREEAEQAAAEVNSWGEEARGFWTEQNTDEDGNVIQERTAEWWVYYTKCSIQEVQVGAIIISRPKQEDVEYARQAKLEKEAKAKAYREKQDAINKASQFFKAQGAEKHCKELAYCLALAGCRTLQDVEHIGAEELVSHKEVSWYIQQHSWYNAADIKQGLRDWKTQLRKPLPDEACQ